MHEGPIPNPEILEILVSVANPGNPGNPGNPTAVFTNFSTQFSYFRLTGIVVFGGLRFVYYKV